MAILCRTLLTRFLFLLRLLAGTRDPILLRGLLAARVPDLAGGLIAAADGSLFQLVGFFLIFEFQKVGYIQEGVTLQAHVHKSGLHTGQDAGGGVSALFFFFGGCSAPGRATPPCCAASLPPACRTSRGGLLLPLTAALS